MQPTTIRWLLLLALAAFCPLLWTIAVVAGVLPFGAILLMTLRNLSDGTLLLWNGVHLAVYAVVLYGLAGLLTRLICRFAAGRVELAVAAFVLLLAGVAWLPLYGAAHGHVQWRSAYALYASGQLR